MDIMTIKNLACQIRKAFARRESIKLPAMRKADFELLMREVRATAIQAV